MDIKLALKPLQLYINSMITEWRDVGLISLMLSFPSFLVENIIAWISIPDNHDYVRIVITAIAIDHLLGSIAHSPWYKNDFNILKNIAGLFIKLLVVICMGTLFEDLGRLVLKEDFIYRYLLLVTRLIIFIYPARSAMLNCRIITKGLFPGEFLLKKSDTFSKTGNIKVFTEEEEKEEQ